MKKTVFIVLMLMAGISAMAQDGMSIYQKYSDKAGVEAVYVSAAMFRLIGRIPDLNVGEDGVNVAPFIQSMQGFYVLNTENEKIGQMICDDADRFIRKGKYELLLEAKEDGEATRIFTVGDEKTIQGIILLAKSPEETSFIAIDGNMDREKLESAIVAAAGE